MASVRHPTVSGRQINADDYADEHEVTLEASDITNALGYTPADASHIHDDRYYTETEIDALLDNQGQPLNGIVTGLGVVYDQDLTFLMAAGSYYLDGELITAAAQSITLDAADASFDRIDVLYLDDAGILQKLTGTPAAAASQPTVDTTTQLFLTFIIVPALATSLPGIVTEVIYDEGTDWTETASAGSIVIDSLNNPNSGTKCIEGTAVPAGVYVKFVDAPFSFEGNGNLIFSIRSKGAWNTKRTLLIRWYENGVARGNQVTLKEGAFGFASANTADYQLIVIDKALFGIPSTVLPTEVRFTAGGSGGTAIGFYLDPIKLQTMGETTGGEVPDHNHDDRYAPLVLVPTAVTGTTYTIQASDKYTAKRLTNALGCTIIVPLNATIPVSVGSRVRFAAEGAGGLTVDVGDPGVTLICRDDFRIGAQGSIIELHKADTNTWWLLGDLQE